MKSSSSLYLFLALTLSVGTFSNPVSAVPISPTEYLYDGDYIEVNFSFNGAPTVDIGSVDMLYVGFGGGGAASTDFEFELFNGTTSLGGSVVQTSSASIWTHGPKPSYSAYPSYTKLATDLSSVINGSIDGRLFMTPIFADTSWSQSITSISVKASSTSCGTSGDTLCGPTYANIDNYVIHRGGGNDIPEPSSIALLGLGLVGVSLVRRKKA